jgi:RNA polymerase sigma factor for flagellar operon FliA
MPTMTKASATTPPPKRQRLSDAECERLITQHTPLVSAIARSLLRRLPANVEADDLIQDGMVGLLVAIIQSTTTQAGRSYNAYLSQRIRGAMLDGLRENDPGSRKVRKEMRRVEVAITQLCHEFGRMPLEGEVAEALGMALDAYQSLLQQADGYTLFSLDDFDEVQQERDFMSWCASTNANPVAALERKIVQRTLLLALSELTEREETVMQAYYGDDRTMREIGTSLGITEGRVSQIHTQAIAKLRAAVLGDDSQPSILKPRWRAV